MSENKNYYAIIPANVRYDEELTPNAKLLYGEITALCNEKGFCWATNSYFAKLYKVTGRSITNWISLLHEKGYIYINYRYKENSKEVEDRCITIIPIEENFYPRKKLLGGIEENFYPPIEKNFLDNNTVFNTTTNKVSKKESFDDLINEYTTNENLINTLKNYIVMRIGIKARPTNNALKLVFNKLNELSNNDDAIKIKILENSIMNGWKGVFPLKNEKDKPQQQTKFQNFEQDKPDFDEMMKQARLKRIKGETA